MFLNRLLKRWRPRQLLELIQDADWMRMIGRPIERGWRVGWRRLEEYEGEKEWQRRWEDFDLAWQDAAKRTLVGAALTGTLFRREERRMPKEFNPDKKKLDRLDNKQKIE